MKEKQNPRTRHKALTATTLTGLMIGSSIVAAAPAGADNRNPQPDGKEINILNPLQEYLAKDYADALDNLEHAPNEKIEARHDLATEKSRIDFTLIEEIIEYYRYDPENDTVRIDTVENYSILSQNMDHPEVQEQVAYYRDLHGSTEEDEQGNTLNIYYKR